MKKITLTWMLVLSNNQKEFQQPSAYQQFNYEGEMYNIHTEKGDLIVSPEHKVYAQIEKDSLRNWSNSSVVKTLTNDCSFRCELFDQIGTLLNSKDKAKKGTSDWSEISGSAFNKNSFDSGIISISANAACLASVYNSNGTLLLEQINSRYLSNSLINDSGPSNLRLYLLINFLVNESLLNKEKTMLVSTTSSIYNLPSFFNLFNMSCLSCLPNFKQSSSVSLLFFNNSSNWCNALSLFTSLSNSSLAISDQFTQLKPFMFSINCSSTANVIEAIYLHPASFSNRFNFSTLLLRPCLNSSFQLTSGCSSNLFFNSSGIDNVILGIFIPPSNYLITSEIFKPSASNYSLIPITEAYALLQEGKEITFFDENNQEIKITGITKEDYSGQIYGVDVENDIVLVRRNGLSILVPTNEPSGTKSSTVTFTGES